LSKVAARNPLPEGAEGNVEKAGEPPYFIGLRIKVRVKIKMPVLGKDPLREIPV
jgi:hypothetical protein